MKIPGNKFQGINFREYQEENRILRKNILKNPGP